MAAGELDGPARRESAALREELLVAKEDVARAARFVQEAEPGESQPEDVQ